MAIPEQITTGPLYGTFPVLSVAAQQEPESPTLIYREDYLWDFERGDFVLDGSGRTVKGDGYVSWAQWCLKSILVQRAAYPVYNHQYGIDIERLLQMNNRGAAESLFIQTVTAALKQNRLTGDVHSFEFTWEPSTLYASFTVQPTVGTSVRVDFRTTY